MFMKITQDKWDVTYIVGVSPQGLKLYPVTSIMIT